MRALSSYVLHVLLKRNTTDTYLPTLRLVFYYDQDVDCNIMRGSRKFCQRMYHHGNVFQSMRGDGRDTRYTVYPNKLTIKSGSSLAPPAKRHLIGVLMSDR